MAKQKLIHHRQNRKIHYWGAIICALPVLVVIVTGLILIVKKESDWVQPPTARGSGELSLSFDEVFEIAKATPELEVEEWKHIDRLDVRPKKGVIKIRGKNRWELQIDGASGDTLFVAYRRSDLIESLHDGSFFSDYVRLGVYLPSAIVLLLLWVTGIFLFISPILKKRANRAKKRQAALKASIAK